MPRPSIRLPFISIPPIFILVGGALAVDYVKQSLKKKKKGACPACGHGEKKGFTVRDKGPKT
jgi:hypothetical protein